MKSFVKLNYKIIFHLMGLLITVNGGFMFVSSIISMRFSRPTLVTLAVIIS
jgi:trk system potassium uptake protein TrkH